MKSKMGSSFLTPLGTDAYLIILTNFDQVLVTLQTQFCQTLL